LLAGDLDVVAAEAGDGYLDPVAVVVELDEVERWIVLTAEIAVLEHVEQPVEADAGAPEIAKVKCTAHVLSSILSNKAGQKAAKPGPRHRARVAPGGGDLVLGIMISRSCNSLAEPAGERTFVNVACSETEHRANGLVTLEG